MSKVSGPLGNDHPVHVAEKNEKQDDLRNKLKEEIEIVFEVSCVKSLHAHTQAHLENTQDD